MLYKLYLTLPVTTCSVECSFSRLKIVKNSLRSAMTECRLSSLLVLSIEQEITDNLNLSNLVDKSSTAFESVIIHFIC